MEEGTNCLGLPENPEICLAKRLGVASVGQVPGAPLSIESFAYARLFNRGKTFQTVKLGIK